MLLSSTITTDAVEKSFGTSPDTVYGVLVGVLVCAVIGLSYAIYRVVKASNEERTEHKKEMQAIYEKHDASSAKKYEDMQILTEKVMTGMEKMTGMIEVLTRK